MSEPRPDRCATCRYFRPCQDEDNWQRGECRRRAPVLIQLHFPKILKENWGDEGKHQFDADCRERVFPRMFPDDWCGEWQKGRSPPAP